MKLPAELSALLHFQFLASGSLGLFFVARFPYVSTNPLRTAKLTTASYFACRTFLF